MPSENALQFTSLEQFVAEVRALHADQTAATDGDPHLCLEWFALLADTAIAAGAQLALCPVSDKSGKSTAYLPLMYACEAPHQLCSLSNYYTPLFDLVNTAQADDRFLRVLAERLHSGSTPFSEVRFAPMNPDSRGFALLKNAFRAGGWLVDDYYCFGNWYQPIMGADATTYFAARPGRLRNTWLRAEKKLARTPGFSLRIVHEPGALLENAIASFVEVYNQSWKQPEPFPRFIPGLCRLAAEKGWLRLGLIEIKGKPLAAQLWLVSANKAYIVKLAYDKAFARSSAGTVLSAALFRHVIEVNRVNEIDYLIGDDAYKQEWMAQRRERRGIVAFNLRSLRGILGALRHYAGKLRKSFSEQ